MTNKDEQEMMDLMKSQVEGKSTPEEESSEGKMTPEEITEMLSRCNFVVNINRWEKGSLDRNYLTLAGSDKHNYDGCKNTKVYYDLNKKYTNLYIKLEDGSFPKDFLLSLKYLKNDFRDCVKVINNRSKRS